MMVPAAINASWPEDIVKATDLFPTMLAALGAAPAPGRLGRALVLGNASG
jgi:hypothetical protein